LIPRKPRIPNDARIPIIGHHRGVGLHDEQDEARLAVVRSEIDFVMDRLSAVPDLYEFACDVSHAPESRLLAGTKALAVFELAAEDRVARPVGKIDRDQIRAVICSLDSLKWRSPWAFCSLLDPGPPPLGQGPQPVKRPAPLRDWEDL
jgi:hypothetical protein